MALEDQVLRTISPTPQQREEVRKAVERLLGTVRRKIASEGLALGVRLVGSVAKDTYLYPPDIDIFILFPPDVPRSELEAVGLRIGRSVLRGEERYAEHPYIHGHLGAMEVDLVPCYKIEDTKALKSAVDRTPFHTDYVLKRLSDAQRDQVRLLKRFMKGVGVYGAEARVQGFSGYLVELLIIRYGDFGSVIQAAKDWKAGISLSLEPIRTRHFDTPLVFYDPVDPSRNVSSALSVDSFARLIHACREFTKKPDVRYFFPRPRENMSISAIRAESKKRGTTPLVVALDRPDLTDDNLYPQIRKTQEAMAALLEGNDFDLMDMAYHAGDRLSFAFELISGELPLAKKHRGPPVWMDQAANFLDKWNEGGLSEPFIESGRWMVMIPREHRRADALLEGETAALSVGSNLKGLRGMKVWQGARALRKENRPVLTEILDKRYPWER